jgi:hypothetical protein
MAEEEQGRLIDVIRRRRRRRITTKEEYIANRDPHTRVKLRRLHGFASSLRDQYYNKN